MTGRLEPVRHWPARSISRPRGDDRAPIVVVDVETTGLRSGVDHIWEVAVLRVGPAGDLLVLHEQIDHDVTLTANLPYRFRADHDARYDPTRAVLPHMAAKALRSMLAAPAHLAAMGDFDARMLEHLLGDRPWHYHTIDIESMMLGAVAAVGDIRRVHSEWRDHTLGEPRWAPWRSDDLSRLIGVQPPSQGSRHTAMGDALWALTCLTTVTKLHLDDAAHAAVTAARDAERAPQHEDRDDTWGDLLVRLPTDAVGHE